MKVFIFISLTFFIATNSFATLTNGDGGPGNSSLEKDICNGTVYSCGTEGFKRVVSLTTDGCHNEKQEDTKAFLKDVAESFDCIAPGMMTYSNYPKEGKDVFSVIANITCIKQETNLRTVGLQLNCINTGKKIND